jgi:hypothetical protein
VPTGKKAGVHEGRVAVRATGMFNIQTGTTTIQGIHHRHCQLLQRADGFGYGRLPPPHQELNNPHHLGFTPPRRKRRGLHGIQIQ